MGEYNIHYYNNSAGSSPYTEIIEVYKINSRVDFINMVTGVRFTIAKKFHIEQLIAGNIIAHSSLINTGYKRTHVYAVNPKGFGGYDISDEIIYYNNTKIPLRNNDIGFTVSFCPRLTYDIQIKQQTFGIYSSYNIALGYRLPWLTAGVVYYPFKKQSNN